MWKGPSPIVSENADPLIEIQKKQDSARRNVELKIIPLNWAMGGKDVKENNLDKTAIFDLFDKQQDQFMETDLFEAMFTHIWDEE